MYVSLVIMVGKKKGRKGGKEGRGKMNVKKDKF